MNAAAERSAGGTMSALNTMLPSAEARTAGRTTASAGVATARNRSAARG